MGVAPASMIRREPLGLLTVNLNLIDEFDNFRDGVDHD